MTIKEFARLCGCSTQTLRYYDKIKLLKPARVDASSGYRYYESKQAIDFVKIKNLQAADFSIEEIKGLLVRSDWQIYEAFERKIAEQTQKLGRIREIQQSYLAEKNTMEQIIYSMTDYLLGQCKHPEILREFGLEPEDAPAILERLRKYLNGFPREEISGEDVSLQVNDELVQGEAAVLSRIRSLTEENLDDTILLRDGYGRSVEHGNGPEPRFEDYTEDGPELTDYALVWQRKDWEHIYEFIDQIPRLDSGESYCLWVQVKHTAYTEDLSFPMFLLGAVLHKQKVEGSVINGCLSAGTDKENHFKLLRKKGPQTEGK